MHDEQLQLLNKWTSNSDTKQVATNILTDQQVDPKFRQPFHFSYLD